MENNQVNNPKHSLAKRLKEVAIIASSEVAAGKPYQWLLLGGTAAGIAFEWGPGNEWLIGATGSSTHEAFDPSNAGELIATSTIAGLAAGTASAVEQSTLGLLMSGTVRTFPKAFSKWDETREHEALNNPNTNKGDVITGIALGASAVVIEKNAQNPNRTFKDDAKMATKTAGVIGAFNATLVTTVSMGVRVLEQAGYDAASNTIEDIAKNPLTYLSIFGLYKANQYRKAARVNRK